MTETADTTTVTVDSPAATDPNSAQPAPEAAPGSALAVRPATPSALTVKMTYARALAGSNMLPAAFRAKPENVLWAVEYGETLGVPTMAALTGIHVIEGKPSASPALMSALIRRAGHKIRVYGNNAKATCQIVRSDDPDFTYEVTWELRKNDNGNPNAEDAQLLSKDTWKKYPGSMLKARAISQCARDACEEVLFGLHYTAEELGAEVNADGEILSGTVGESTTTTSGPAPGADDALSTQVAAAIQAAVTSDNAVERLRQVWAGYGVHALQGITLTIDGVDATAAEHIQSLVKKVSGTETTPAEQPASAPAADGATVEQPSGETTETAAPVEGGDTDDDIIDAEVIEDDTATASTPDTDAGTPAVDTATAAAEPKVADRTTVAPPEPPAGEKEPNKDRMIRLGLLEVDFQAAALGLADSRAYLGDVVAAGADPRNVAATKLRAFIIEQRPVVCAALAAAGRAQECELYGRIGQAFPVRMQDVFDPQATA